MTERGRRPDFARQRTLRGAGRVSVSPNSKSLVEAVLEAEGVDPSELLSRKQLRKLRKASPGSLPIGYTANSR